MKIRLKKTQRGFRLGEFTDYYGQRCSIQDSSLATEAAIWLGVDVDLKGREVFQRMHLNQEQAAELVRLLARFVETGTIGEKRTR